MTLHCDVSGSGPNLVLLHGWGMHSALWQGISHELANNYRITQIDLPGHGLSPGYQTPLTLSQLTDQVAKYCPDQYHLMAWSLGGLIAQKLATQQVERIEKLILIASNACFVQTQQWPHALAAPILQGFAERLQEDTHNTLQRFIALQVMGCNNERSLLRKTQTFLKQRGPACKQALIDGLDILRRTDLRSNLAQIKCPLLMIAGNKDRITPAQAFLAMQTLSAQSQTYIIEGAGHAPFLSHPELFLNAVRNHLQELP